MRKLMWAAVPGYERYEVSTDGRVRSLNYNGTGKIKEMKFRFIGPYLGVKLSKNGITKVFKVQQQKAQGYRDWETDRKSVV